MKKICLNALIMLGLAMATGSCKKDTNPQLPENAAAFEEIPPSDYVYFDKVKSSLRREGYTRITPEAG